MERTESGLVILQSQEWDTIQKEIQDTRNENHNLKNALRQFDAYLKGDDGS